MNQKETNKNKFSWIFISKTNERDEKMTEDYQKISKNLSIFFENVLIAYKKKSQISLGSSMEHDNLVAAYSSPNKVFEIVSPLFCTSYLKSPRSVGEAK